MGRHGPLAYVARSLTDYVNYLVLSHPENSSSSGFAPFSRLPRQIDRHQYITCCYHLRLAFLGVLSYADPPASTKVPMYHSGPWEAGSVCHITS